MIYCISNMEKKLDRFLWIIIFLIPLLSSCSTNQTKVVEVILPPKSPKDFSYIPEGTDTLELLALQSVEQKTKNINVGRFDPFLPPQIYSNSPAIPKTFKYHGQISSGDVVNAFVSYEDQKGTIKQGDIGGKSTNLLPQGWVVNKIDLKTKSLILSFDSSPVKIDLFPKEKP